MRDILATVKIDGDKLIVASDYPTKEYYLPDSTAEGIVQFLARAFADIAGDLADERPWVKEEHYCPLCKVPPKSIRCRCTEGTT